MKVCVLVLPSYQEAVEQSQSGNDVLRVSLDGEAQERLSVCSFPPPYAEDGSSHQQQPSSSSSAILVSDQSAATARNDTNDSGDGDGNLPPPDYSQSSPSHANLFQPTSSSQP